MDSGLEAKRYSTNFGQINFYYVEIPTPVLTAHGISIQKPTTDKPAQVEAEAEATARYPYPNQSGF